jgi:hypothetical protein
MLLWQGQNYTLQKPHYTHLQPIPFSSNILWLWMETPEVVQSEESVMDRQDSSLKCWEPLNYQSVWGGIQGAREARHLEDGSQSSEKAGEDSWEPAVVSGTYPQFLNNKIPAAIALGACYVMLACVGHSLIASQPVHPAESALWIIDLGIHIGRLFAWRTHDMLIYMVCVLWLAVPWPPPLYLISDSAELSAYCFEGPPGSPKDFTEVTCPIR